MYDFEPQRLWDHFAHFDVPDDDYSFLHDAMTRSHQVVCRRLFAPFGCGFALLTTLLFIVNQEGIREKPASTSKPSLVGVFFAVKYVPYAQVGNVRATPLLSSPLLFSLFYCDEERKGDNSEFRDACMYRTAFWGNQRVSHPPSLFERVQYSYILVRKRD